MKTVEIHIPEDVAVKIEQVARKKGISVDDLIRSTLEEKLARDAEFDKAARFVLTKNAELYERLS